MIAGNETGTSHGGGWFVETTAVPPRGFRLVLMLTLMLGELL